MLMFSLRIFTVAALAMPFFAAFAHAADQPNGPALSATGTPGKSGGGTAGLRYTKVANNGGDLPASATLGVNAGDWACTRDNVSGLLWEVKTTSGLRGQDHFYTWYNSDTGTNAGSPGVSNGGDCHTPGRCDTEKFVADVNATALCGHSDWRLPSRSELLGLVLAGADNPSIDTKLFPNTPEFGYWSGSSYEQNPDLAWTIYFTYGYPYFYGKLNDYCVRLVRNSSP